VNGEGGPRVALAAFGDDRGPVRLGKGRSRIMTVCFGAEGAGREVGAEVRFEPVVTNAAMRIKVR
jgi:hypothetical protein